MAAVTFTQDQINSFITAMNANPGVIEMQIGDRLYRFENLKEKREHLAYMQRNISTGQAGRVRYASTNKGFPTCGNK